MDITEAILKVANNYGRLHGYILTEEGALDAAKSKFWGNLAASIKHKSETGKSLVIPYVKYILPMFEDNEEVEKHGVPKVEIDMHFGNPRLSIRTNKFDFCCLTFNRDTSRFTESQAWGDRGIELALSIKMQIENNLKQGLDEHISQKRTE